MMDWGWDTTGDALDWGWDILDWGWDTHAGIGHTRWDRTYWTGHCEQGRHRILGIGTYGGILGM